VITASEASWIVPLVGLSPRQSGKLMTFLRRDGARDRLDTAQDLHNGAIDTTGRISGSLADIRRYDRALTDQQAYALHTSAS
jgi:hypothetical protein